MNQSPGFMLGELCRFLRVETCLFIGTIAASGFLMFNPISAKMMLILTTVFFSSAIGYAYNHITDKEEDIINNSRLNVFALRRSGYAIVAACLCISLMSAVFLSRVSFFLYLIGIPLVLAYSGLRIGGRRVKEIFVLKNVYTGLTICIAFLIGAWAADIAAFAVFPYVPLIFLLGFTLNALGDIRGYEGDVSAGVMTIPVVLGVGTAKLVLYSISGIFIICVLAMNSMMFLPLIPFMLMISIFVSMGKHRHARFSILSSFIFLFAFLALANMLGGL